MTATAAKQQLVNAALAHLGEEPIADINADPPSPKLAKVLAQLDGPSGVERWVLARHPWLCALDYQTLSPSGSIAATYKWAYAFELPATYVKLAECSATAFEVGRATVGSAIKTVIWTDDETLDVAYVRQWDFEAYDADLSNAMAYELAARTAGPLQSNYDAARRLHDQALEAISAAATGEAGQHGTDEALIEGNFAAARSAGSF